MIYSDFKKISNLFSKYSKNAQKALGKPSTLRVNVTFDLEKILQNFYSFELYTYAIVDVTKLKIDSIGGSFLEITGFHKKDFENKGLFSILKLYTTVDLIRALLGSHHYYKYLYAQPGLNRAFIKSNRIHDTIKKDGTKVHTLIQSIPVLFNDDYEVVKFLVIMTDISKVKSDRSYRHYIIDSSERDQVKKIDIGYFSYEEEKGFGPSPAEKKVLNLLAEGLSSKQIADKLFLSEHTVKNHRKNMLKKLNCQSSSALVRTATVKGWI